MASANVSEKTDLSMRQATIFSMRRTLCVLLGVMSLALVSSACTRASAPGVENASTPSSSGSGAMTPAIQEILDSIRVADAGQLAVSEEDGRFLRLLVATRSAKSILEIGGASGYSGI